MRVIIFGHGGFIGQVLSTELAKLDSFEILHYNYNILNIEKLKEFAQSYGRVNILIHCAGKYNGSYSELYNNNYIITQNILSVYENLVIDKFIYLSSGAVYSHCNDQAADENDKEYPETHYGEIKFLCENEILNSKLAQKTDVTILRLPSVYGIKNNKGVIFNFLLSIKTNFVINVQGDGSQKRSFLNIGDLVTAILHIILKERIVCTNRIFNISESCGYSISDIANYIYQKWEVPINYIDSKNELQNMVLKSEKIRTFFGWESKYEIKYFLDQEIAKIIGSNIETK